MIHRVLGALTVVGIAILLFVPARGVISISATTQSFVSRLVDGRFNSGEEAELARLDCVADAISVIPDGSDVYIHPITDPYLSQRLIEIAFPRVRPVGPGAPYEIYAEDSAPPGTAIIADSVCADLTITVVDGA